MTYDNIINKCDEIIYSIDQYLKNRNNVQDNNELKYFISDYPENVYDLLEIIIFLKIFDRNYLNNFNEKYFDEIQDLDLYQIGTCVTMIFRTEHFYNGYLYECIKNGILVKLIKRFKQVFII